MTDRITPIVSPEDQPLKDQKEPALNEAELMRADLYAIGQALGIGAKPYSGHDAVRIDFIPRIAALTAASEGWQPSATRTLVDLSDALYLAVRDGANAMEVLYMLPVDLANGVEVTLPVTELAYRRARAAARHGNRALDLLALSSRAPEFAFAHNSTDVSASSPAAASVQPVEPNGRDSATSTSRAPEATRQEER